MLAFLNNRIVMIFKNKKAISNFSSTPDVLESGYCNC